MRRGAISKERHQLKERISGAIAAQGVPIALADRIALQVVFKFDGNELNDRAVWAAMGELLRQEIAQLKTQVGLADPQIVRVLPKLSARRVVVFLKELITTNRRIARTILNAALEAAEPLSAGRRYLEQYCHVAEQLDAIDPRMARTLANATFMAGAPRHKAMELLKRFSKRDDSSPPSNPRD